MMISRKRSLQDITSAARAATVPRKLVCITSALPSRMPLKKCKSESDIKKPPRSPLDFILSTLKSGGINDPNIRSFSDVENLFFPPTQQEIEGYGPEILNAVRTQNIEQLKTFQAEGKPLKCSNRFGESILHLACRRGFTKVVDYLVNEAGVPLWVKDDYGRNPLHDACWTPTPNFELIDVIIQKCPDLFLISDARGHTPLNYVRQEYWNDWLAYLSKKTDDLKPHRLAYS